MEQNQYTSKWLKDLFNTETFFILDMKCIFSEKNYLQDWIQEYKYLNGTVKSVSLYNGHMVWTEILDTGLIIAQNNNMIKSLYS